MKSYPHPPTVAQSEDVCASARLLVLVGGRSPEHDASLKSAENLLADPSVDAHAVAYITAGGAVVIHDTVPVIDEKILGDGPHVSPAELAEYATQHRFFVLSLLHGGEGENGGWAGWAQIHGIAGSFGNVFPAALGMHKTAAAAVAAHAVPELHTPTSVLVSNHNRETQLRRADELFRGTSVVVKPNGLGASLLTSLLPGWQPAVVSNLVDEILQFSDSALVQQFVEGVEYSCGVLDDGVKIEALPVMRIVSGDGFYSHTEKHSAANRTTKEFVDDETADLLRTISLELFRTFDSFGFARFDYIVDSDGAVYFLEVNGIPGLMAGSIYPAMLAKTGRNLGDLVRTLKLAAKHKPRLEHVLRYKIEEHA